MQACNAEWCGVRVSGARILDLRLSGVRFGAKCQNCPRVEGTSGGESPRMSDGHGFNSSYSGKSQEFNIHS